MFSDFLRKNWYWILGALASFLLFIISPVLFIIVFAVILAIYFLVIRRRRGGVNAEGVVTTRVRVLRSVSSQGVNDLRLSRVCLSVGVGEGVVRIGDRWISALLISTLDYSLLRDIIGLGAVISDNNNHYLVIYGESVDDVSVKLNTAIELLKSRNVLFRQLSSSDIINEVILRWMN
ncbi:MAG: hypothetical protein ACP5GZ_06025 [Vulcanisaeta sp.]|jgi:hypothetical protein|uniref:Uncharacterized protein n=1 Tax=Vulcanisaeta moutnovskia (strain 768-28) TaxID=985053 RepID=F0QTY5_VULM7|nr:hypothetical protein [Vulcanisaeta moutnovskia]ADY01771.1 hypothetical protein VMUT_1567 [Vulcanisaeta moutnovskia 768-28]